MYKIIIAVAALGALSLALLMFRGDSSTPAPSIPLSPSSPQPSHPASQSELSPAPPPQSPVTSPAKTPAAPTPTPTPVSTPAAAPTPPPTPAPSAVTPQEKVVEMTAQGFSPSTLTIPVGTTVRFINRDSIGHWPASGVHPAHQVCPGFDALRSLQPGQSYSFTFTSAKVCPMHDHLSPGMQGTIRVE